MKLKNLLSIFAFIYVAGILAQTSTPAEEFVKITDNGSWCWFADPRAVYANDQYYGGYVDSTGNVWNFSYNPVKQEVKTFKQFDKIAKDDHCNPSIITLKDGKLVTFFSGHGGMSNTPIYYRISKNKYDITEWEPLQEIHSNVGGGMGTCYPNPSMLSAEKNRIYVYFRGADFKPTVTWTDDLKQWASAKTFIKDKGARPYVKIASNNKDRIHFAFTDGHPRNEYLNSIYYVCYRNGAYETAAGQKIASMEEIPIAPSQCEKVYDASKSYQRSWIWDVAYDKEDRPVIVYARFFSELKHEYWYARWDGKQWLNSKIADAGRWFPNKEIAREKWEGEPHYSGGVYLDHNNPDIVYTSVPVKDVFEIQRRITADMGKTWTSENITSGSVCDNVRPFVPRNAPDSRVMWMYNHSYISYLDYHTAIRISEPFKGYSSSLKKDDVKNVAQLVADWQIDDLNATWKEGKGRGAELTWVNGALYIGIFDWATLVNNDNMFKWLTGIGNRNYWQVASRMYHADDICMAQTYLKLYEKYKKQNMIQPTIDRTNWVMTNLKTENMKTQERWNWCDALFMAPAVYANLYTVTGDEKYLKFMDQEFKATYDFLYDKGEKLFFRDASYFDRKEANGEKIFWGRGNGWVVGGLVNILKILPKDNSYRPFYENLFKEMCGRLAQLQGKDGYWHASLLDPASYPSPETSASGFMVYALAYGVNNGMLDAKTYMPTVEKGWKALVDAVDTEGKLGWVQPIGQDPRKVTRNQTELYGVGAFLAASTEIYKMSK